MKQTLDALVNPFGDLKSDSPQNIQTTKTELDAKVETMYLKFRSVVHFVVKNHGIDFMVREKAPLDTWEYIRKMNLTLLTPAQIDNVVQKTVVLHDSWMKSNPKLAQGVSNWLGCYLNNLLNVSYRKGNNNFVLSMGDLQVESFLSGFIGIKKRPLEVLIKGNVGVGPGYCCNSIISVEGNSKMNFGAFARNSTFAHYGQTGEYFAKDAYNCTFTLDGDAGDKFAANAEKSTFTVGGKIGKLSTHCPKKCTFYAKEKHTYERLRKWADGKQGNKVIYLG